MYRGKEIFKPLNTGWIDENVACVREWVANIFFYRKGDPGTFLRQTAGGAGGNRNFDHLKRRKYRLFYTRKILLVFAKYPSSSLFSDTP